MSRLGYSIRILRQARDLTAAQVAAKAKISAAYLSLIEKGNRLPPAITLKRLAQAMDIDVAILEAFVDPDISAKRSKYIHQLNESLERLLDAETELRRKLG
jgi:transcriptional regulator with XRE-family HTH domain